MSALTLDILIRTIADQRGIQATNDEVKQLAENLNAASRAGQEVNVSADSIADALQKQKSATTAAASEWEKMTEAQKQSHREAAQEALRMMAGAEAKKKAADQTKVLAKDLGALRQAGQGAQMMFAGLTTGGIGGFLQAGRGALQMVNALKTGLNTLARGGGLGAAIAGAGMGGILILRKQAELLQADMERMWAANDAGLKRYEERSKALTEQVAKDQEKQREAIEKTIATYDRLLAQISAAESRVNALNKATMDRANAKLDAEETAALAKARTPEERQRIEREFAGKRADLKTRGAFDDIANQELQAGVRERAAQDGLFAATGRLREIDVQEANLKRNADNAVAYAKSLPLGSDAQRDAQREARAAQDALKKFQDGAKGDRATLQGQISQAYGEIDTARNNRELAGVQRDTQTFQGEKRVSELKMTPDDLRSASESATGRVRSAEAAIAAEKERAFRGGFGEQADTGSLERELAAARAAEAEANRVMLEDAKARKKESDKLKEQIKAGKQNTTGGG